MCSHSTPKIVMPINGRCRSIDSCIHHMVAALNAANILTASACCGHGHRPGSIILDDGQELLIMPSQKEALELTKGFPDIHGNPITATLNL